MKSLATPIEKDYQHNTENHLRMLAENGSILKIVNNFSKYARRQEITKFIARYELFKKIIDIKGSIIECGVYAGQGLMSWAQLSTILEPVSFFRKIYGFDTFEGFPSINANDIVRSNDHNITTGDLREDSFDELQRCVELYDMNRFLSHIEKVEIIKGDFIKTGEEFIKDNPHVIVSLLFLDFDLYEPTKKAIEIFLPRMPKGSIIAFDEVNNQYWPGETLALLESFNLNNLRLSKFPFEPNIAFARI